VIGPLAVSSQDSVQGRLDTIRPPLALLQVRYRIATQIGANQNHSDALYFTKSQLNYRIDIASKQRSTLKVFDELAELESQNVCQRFGCQRNHYLPLYLQKL
jgi:hypothetical protein